MLDSTVVCRRALGCEWGGPTQIAVLLVRLFEVYLLPKLSFLTFLIGYHPSPLTIFHEGVVS